MGERQVHLVSVVERGEHRTFSPGASEAEEGAHSPAGLGFPPLLLAGEGMDFAELEHQCSPWESAGEGREGDSGYPRLCSLLHFLPSTSRRQG